MLARARASRHILKHVISPPVRAVNAPPVSRTYFSTSVCFGRQKSAEYRAQSSQRSENEATRHQQPYETLQAHRNSGETLPASSHVVEPTVLPEDELGYDEEYTSLTTQLDHYAYSPTAHERPFRRNHQPLASLLPRPPSANHNSQRNFLAHSQRSALNPASAVFMGTRYEYVTLSSLRRLGIEVARVGGTGDKGVDLVGFWHLPQWIRPATPAADSGTRAEEVTDGSEAHQEKIKVLVQCKRISPTTRASKTIGPNVVRELEGAFRGAPPGWKGASGGDSVVGLLVSTRAATKGVVEGMRRSERALGWVLLEEMEEVQAEDLDAEASGPLTAGLEAEPASVEADDSEEQQQASETLQKPEYTMAKGRVRQILWNQKAKELGLEGLDVVKRYATKGEGDLGDEVVLMWKGKAVEGLRDDNEQ
jgi:Protein of unknown function (DUF2034)